MQPLEPEVEGYPIERVKNPLEFPVLVNGLQDGTLFISGKVSKEFCQSLRSLATYLDSISVQTDNPAPSRY